MEAITQPLEDLPSPLAVANTDRCPNCNARMAADQRYCIECGERRSGGGLRDSLPRPTAATVPAARTRRSFGATPNSTLIAGIATLLLAMGVGVLIGKSGDGGGSKAAAAPQVVTVQTSGAAGGTSTAATAAATTAAATKVAKSSAAKKPQAASKSSSSTSGAGDVQKTAAKNGVKLPPRVVRVGQSCAKGTAGCTGGKFTGNYFGN